jgi:ribonuclease BN (tRNA processing enzyme)
LLERAVSAQLVVRVLGCSGAIARDCRTTSFLIGEDLLVDAGTGVGDLSLAEMQRIDHVVLTHSHLDHIAALPLMLDSCTSLRKKPVVVYALSETISALQTHVFNNVLWPDFSKLPTPQSPFVRFEQIDVGQTLRIGDREIEVMSAVHTVPACGYAVRALGEAEPGPWWIFTGDTERNPAFWARLNQMEVGALVIETAFSDRERDLARRALHLAPATLAEEIDCIDPIKHFPIYITHTKPAESEMIMAEVLRFDDTDVFAAGVRHDIRMLRAGQVIAL